MTRIERFAWLVMTTSSFLCGARLQACRVDIRVDVRPQGAI
jgi:hypothetical protein